MTYQFYNSRYSIAQAALVFVAMMITMTNAAMAFDKVNKTFFGVAIKGYDTVAYHSEGRAVDGKSEFSHHWNDAKWYFTNAKNRDLFAADPERYAPQYGGYWAENLATTGKVAGVNPENFKIINGKLYLSWNQEGSESFAQKADDYIEKADGYWTKLNE